MANASNDYAQNVVFDLIYSFYSIDQIIEAKDLLANLLKKDADNRRTPDKKRKDLEDVVKYFDELKQSTRGTKEIFLADSYKKLPPVGMEFIAPILANLSEEVSKLNHILPKISDIKTEVINTADTVRSLKTDVYAMQKALITSNARSVMNKSPYNNNTNNNIMTFRNNNGTADSHKSVSDSKEPVDGNSRKVSQQNPFSPQPPNLISNKIVNLQNQILNNASTSLDLTCTPKPKASIIVQNRSLNSMPHSTDLDRESSEDCSDFTGNNWKEKRPRNSIRREAKRRNSSNIVTGKKKSNSDNFKSAERFVDVFIGRADKSVNAEIISEYATDNFDVNCKDVEKLVTKTDQYNCFKVKVNINDRDKLFKSEFWPEGIIVKKYYLRKRN